MLFRQNSVRVAYQLAGRSNMPQLGEKIETIRRSKFVAHRAVEIQESSVKIARDPSGLVSFKASMPNAQPSSKQAAIRPKALPIAEDAASPPVIGKSQENDEGVSILTDSAYPPVSTNPFKKKSVRPVEPTPTNVFQAIQQHEDRKIEGKNNGLDLSLLKLK